VAADVAKVLGYRNAPDMTRNIDDEDKGTQIVRTLGGTQEITIINESGLYTAIIYSRRPEAKAFRRKVTSEILPSIRKHGGYIQVQEEMDDDELMANALLMAQSKIEENCDNHNRSGRRGAKASLPEQLGLKIRAPENPPKNKC